MCGSNFYESDVILIQNRNKNNLLCTIVCDCMVYPEPKFLISKTKKTASFFFEVGGWFFLIPCYHQRLWLSRKTFAKNSLR